MVDVDNEIKQAVSKQNVPMRKVVAINKKKSSGT